MITFVNAKINLGLEVVRRRPDGYHDLSTIFYPVGLYSGTPPDPGPFCDVLEIIPAQAPDFICTGMEDEVPREKNLVWRAYEAFMAETELEDFPVVIRLEKHLPAQAGMGGGSADCAFTLSMLNDLAGKPLPHSRLSGIAARLGADCPFFLINRPALGAGIGERLTPLAPRLAGLWCAVAKPAETMSTRQAFASIIPTGGVADLSDVYSRPLQEWRGAMVNAFEAPFLSLYPHCRAILESLYASGAIYASLSGSGSAFFGIFPDHAAAAAALGRLEVPYKALCLL